MCKQIWTIKAPPHILQDLKDRLLRSWCQIPDTFGGFVESMPQRVRAVLAAQKGTYTILVRCFLMFWLISLCAYIIFVQSACLYDVFNSTFKATGKMKLLETQALVHQSTVNHSGLKSWSHMPLSMWESMHEWRNVHLWVRVSSEKHSCVLHPLLLNNCSSMKRWMTYSTSP